MRFRTMLRAVWAIIAMCCLFPTLLNAQPYSLLWTTIDGGGGYSTGGAFELDGTTGQPDSGVTMSGGRFQMAGGFWTGAGNEPVQIGPYTYRVTRGNLVSGGIGELINSDNRDLSMQRSASDVQSRTEFEVIGTSPTATPTGIDFTLEGSVFARSNVVQTIELYDYQAATWVLVGNSNAVRSPSPDSVVTVSATGDLSRFVQPGTQNMVARVRYKSDQPRQNFASNTDQVIWTIGR